MDYVQPDAIHCGGITEMRKIAVVADTFRIEVLPHNRNSRVCTFASLQGHPTWRKTGMGRDLRMAPLQTDSRAARHL